MSEKTASRCNEIHSTFWGDDQATRELATQCRNEMEQKTGKPYGVKFSSGVASANPVESFFWVFPLRNCNEDRSVFDDYTGNRNAIEAKECAEALSRVTKSKYKVVITPRYIFADIHTVVKAK